MPFRTVLLAALAVLGGAAALAMGPGRPLVHGRTTRSLAQHSSRRVCMQVEAPVKPKIPDNVPQLAPTKPSSDKDNEKAKKYKVLLFNDNVNRREYVARVLCGSIPGLSQADAYLIMQKAHKQGMAVVGVWVFEMAEAYCDKLKSGGLIASVTEEE